MHNNHHNLVLGPRWLARSAKIEQLRSRYSLPAPAIGQTLTFTCPTMLPAASIDKPSAMETQALGPAHTSSEAKQPCGLPSMQHSYSEWEQLVSSAKNCQQCALCEGRRQVVFERGKRNAKWMFIGEAPGENEDLQGLPFVGAAGQLLDKMIAAMKLNPHHDVYIANVIKCRPPHNRNPNSQEIAACSNYLFSQIALVKPTMIITLGRFAAHTLLATDIAIGKLRGKVHDYQGIPLIVTYHPAYLLRTPEAKQQAWQDLQLALANHNS